MPQPQRDRCNYQPVSTGHAKRQPAVTLDYRYPIEQGISFDTAHDLSQRQKHGLARQYSGQMQWQNYQYDLNERQQQHLQHHPQRPQWHQNNQNQQKFTRNWQRHYQQPQQRYQQPPPRSYQQPLLTREDEFPVREQQAWHPRPPISDFRILTMLTRPVSGDGTATISRHQPPTSAASPAQLTNLSFLARHAISVRPAKSATVRRPSGRLAFPARR
ncbi:hypothetical protein BOX15_Mlig032557g3 [Macrostomum lignano]|uniref:Uncharacterized protein n=1 Tax=Macrostomum lignano TaxID=282301 RepID=A0A267E3E5_9PLAT|nr:hypothetical protein BOX15_Mlig032557g3 [Macrostomum lignano]